MEKFICALDQGTTSTRTILFSESGQIINTEQIEHKQYYPKPGWVEHDADEIWLNTITVLNRITQKYKPEQITGIGITNQRETIVAWDRITGKALGKAIVWQDQRTADYIENLKNDSGINRFRKKTGLPLSPYFSASKINWMLHNRKEVKSSLKLGTLCFGTIDSWLVFNLTGGAGKGVYITDTTNASRTMLMNIESLKWDEELLEIFEIPVSVLPEIVDSIPEKPYAVTTPVSLLGGGIPIAGILGDQQAALFGQACFEKGQCKCTYGTGCFLLFNTGEEIVQSDQGLLTTVAYTQSLKDGEHRKIYALEGSVAIAGSLVQWMRDNMGLIKESAEIEKLAAEVDDSGDVYFVPAFSGLFAPYWKSDARGIIAGMTAYTRAAHIARAVLEATAFQTMELVKAMVKDASMNIHDLKVDGGMTVNEILMQFQADILDLKVIRPVVRETTALGAAYAAGLTLGFWKDIKELNHQWSKDKNWKPKMKNSERVKRIEKWLKAVEKSFAWNDSN